VVRAKWQSAPVQHSHGKDRRGKGTLRLPWNVRLLASQRRESEESDAAGKLGGRGEEGSDAPPLATSSAAPSIGPRCPRMEQRKRGNAAFAAGDYSGAVELYLECVSDEAAGAEEHKLAHSNLALAYYALKNYDESYTHAHESTEIDATFAKVRLC